MNRLFISAEILLLAAALLTGCADSGKQPPAVSEETAPEAAVTEATETASAAASTVTSAAPAATSAAAKSVTAAPETTASAETTAPEPAAFGHWIEAEQALFSRTVPEQYLSYDLPAATRRAAEEGREITGSLYAVCADEAYNNIYVCIYYGNHYGFGGEELSVRKGYSFYRIDSETAAITELANDDDSPLRNLQSMFWLGGRLLVSSYHGFYAVDTENGGLITIDADFEPLCGGASVSGGKVSLTSVLFRDSGSTEEHYREYDPASDTIREMTLEEAKAFPHDMNAAQYAAKQQSSFRTTEKKDESGNLIYRIEWGGLPAE